MNAAPQLRVRRSLTELQDDYTTGNKKPLEDLMRAWKGIKELPDDPRSFFTLGGFHGESFRGAGWGSPIYWGGYCNHGNVLFHVASCLSREAGRGPSERPRLRGRDAAVLG
jgi:tyrosinase